jgi:hypothetical protein
LALRRKIPKWSDKIATKEEATAFAARRNAEMIRFSSEQSLAFRNYILPEASQLLDQLTEALRSSGKVTPDDRGATRIFRAAC